MKGIVLLINEPPNNKRSVVFKHTPLDIKQPHKIDHQIARQPRHQAAQKTPQQILQEIYRKCPQIQPEEESWYSITGSKKQVDEKQIDEIKTIFGLEKGFFKELFIPKENTFQNSIFDLTVEGNRFLSFPYFFEDKDIKVKQIAKKDQKGAKGDIPEAGKPQQMATSTFKEEEGAVKIKAFNIIFVLDSYDQECFKKIQYYSAVLQTITEAYAREQIRDSYLGKQCYKILKIKQQQHDQKIDKQAIQHVIMRDSNLASNIKDLFESFFYNKAAQLRINQWIQFSINQLPQFTEIDQTHNQGHHTQYENAECIKILPNQTLILFDLAKSLNGLPDDCTPLVEEAICMISPTRSLSQTCVEHGIAYSEILKVARHLVFWNQAKIIYPISLSQVYVINKAVSHKEIQRCSKIFSQKFPHLASSDKMHFEKLLSKFSIPKKLEVHNQSLRMTGKDFVNMVSFMLQNSLIEEKSLYIVLKVSSIYENLKEKQQLFFEQSYMQLSRDQSHRQIQSLTRAQHLKKSIQKFRSQSVENSQLQENRAAQSPNIQSVVTMEEYLELVHDLEDQEFKLLQRIYPFFTGEYNHHDIMMITNCSRVTIDKLIEKHPSVIEKFWLQ